MTAEEIGSRIREIVRYITLTSNQKDLGPAWIAAAIVVAKEIELKAERTSWDE